jgi:hypothetical protein
MVQETDYTEAIDHVYQIENLQLWEILHDCFTQMMEGIYCCKGLSNRVRDLTTDAAPARLRCSVDLPGSSIRVHSWASSPHISGESIQL